MASDHNRDIATAARSILQPIGCVQQGRSRTWFDDRGWWVGVIEFQPSGFSKGSYLNVGTCFLWSRKGYFSFDDRIGDRPWYAAEGESFTDKAIAPAELARDSILQLRQRHSDTAKTGAWMSGRARLSNWGHFHAAVALGLSGDIDDARTHFEAAIVDGTDIEWILDLNRTCAQLSQIVGDHDGFVETVSETVHCTRRLMRLPEVRDLDLTRSNSESR